MTLFFLKLYILRTYNGHNTYSFEVYQHSDNQGHPESCSFFTNDSPISIGQLTYYKNFINTSVNINKKKTKNNNTIQLGNQSSSCQYAYCCVVTFSLVLDHLLIVISHQNIVMILKFLTNVVFIL